MQPVKELNAGTIHLISHAAGRSKPPQECRNSVFLTKVAILSKAQSIFSKNASLLFSIQPPDLFFLFFPKKRPRPSLPISQPKKKITKRIFSHGAPIPNSLAIKFATVFAEAAFLNFGCPEKFVQA